VGGLTIYNAGEATAYRLTDELRRGMEGRTYRAEQIGEDGGVLPVALKVLTPESWLGREVDPGVMLRKWRSQMHVLRSFNHEGLAPVQVAFPVSAWPAEETETPEDWLGVPAFVMAWIEGHALDDWSQGVGDPVRRVDILQLAAEGIDAFHRQTGHVHCDLKPANIMVDSGERTRIVDFGLVRAAERLSTGSILAGTPGYHDPHVLETREYTPASDIFSFAGVIFHQLTGDHPVQNRTPARTREALRAAGFDEIGPLLAYALSPDPELRPPVAGAAELLDRALAGIVPAATAPLPFRPVSSPESAPTIRVSPERVTGESLGRTIVLRILTPALVVTVLTVMAVLLLRSLNS